jgi:hypothetical protein
MVAHRRIHRRGDRAPNGSSARLRRSRSRRGSSQLRASGVLRKRPHRNHPLVDPSARRYIDVWIACGAWVGALVGVAIGNLRVVDAIGVADWTDEQADALGAGLNGFESGHDLAEMSMWLGVAAAIILAIVLLVRGQIGRGVAIGAVIVSVLFPPWIVPGVGVLVLAIALCVARSRRLHTTM